ncbi:hypothetical protein MEX01_34990 [Methylorubrum extorquens]|nr:hypothetical protein MEX01_34990 [Methylorubrum extorquens]
MGLVPVAPPAAPSTFYFDGHPVRVVPLGGEPRFVASDVCEAIDLRDVSDAVGKLDDDEKGRASIPTPGGLQSLLVVTESGLYTMVLRSRTAMTPGSVAHRFRRWVTSEVLPAIRQTGGYGTPAPAHGAAALMDLMRNPATALELIGHYASANLALQEKIEAAAPAVAFQEALVESQDTWGLQEAGKALGQKSNGFIQWLLARGDIYRRSKSLCAKQHLIDRGLLKVRWEPYGSTPKPVTQVTGKGVVHYARLLGVKPPALSRQGKLPGF